MVLMVLGKLVKGCYIGYVYGKIDRVQWFLNFLLYIFIIKFFFRYVFFKYVYMYICV